MLSLVALGTSCIITPPSRPSSYRCLLHCHPVIPLEGVCHHLGQLPPPLRPQVPAQAVLSPQLLEAHLLSCKTAGASGLRSPRRGQGPHRSRRRWMAWSRLALEAPLRRDWAPNRVGTLADGREGPESCTCRNRGCYAVVRERTGDLMAHLGSVWVTASFLMV